MARAKQPLSVAIYLGSADDRRRRIIALDRLAALLASSNRSRLIQMIADGELELIPRTTSSASDPDIDAGEPSNLT